MSRTRKGSRGPGWELWTNIRERQEAEAESRREDVMDDEDEICPGCRFCCCVKCGGYMSSRTMEEPVACIDCGHQEEDQK